MKNNQDSNQDLIDYMNSIEAQNDQQIAQLQQSIVNTNAMIVSLQEQIIATQNQIAVLQNNDVMIAEIIAYIPVDQSK